ncbi:hypothetical protein Tco_1252273 [Tanacetum coccineum]
MSNMSKDIKYVGSDTRPPVLDRTDYESWQQRIHLYCLGKDNGEDIMKSINQDLTQKEKEWYKADIRATNILLQGIPKDIYALINHYTDAKDIWDNVKMLLEGSELTKDDRESRLYNEFEQFCQIKGETIHAYYVTNFEYDVDDPPEQDLTLNVHHIFEADQCDAFDSDVDEAPTAQTMFMVNLSSEDPIYDEAWPSYDSKTSSEVQDHDNFADNVDEYHEVHEMQNDVQHNYVVDSDAEYTSDSNIIPYDQYVEDNEENVVQSNVSFVQNDALMSIIDEMHKHDVQSKLTNKQDKVVNYSLTSELVRYKELVGMYEKQAKFELTKREQKIDEQMRIIISD